MCACGHVGRVLATYILYYSCMQGTHVSVHIRIVKHIKYVCELIVYSNWSEFSIFSEVQH